MAPEAQRLLRDLTLQMLYLTSWRERKDPSQLARAWKGYDLVILDHLADEGLTLDSRTAKSVHR